MFENVLDNFSKATESTLQLQQEMYRAWTRQFAQVPGLTQPANGSATNTAPNAAPGAAFGSGVAEQVFDFQKKWAEGITEMLGKHREMLNDQYKAGIKTIDDAFKVAQAKDPEQFRKLTEELWRQSFETLKSFTETQLRGFQGTMEKCVETVTKGVAAATKH